MKHWALGLALIFVAANLDAQEHATKDAAAPLVLTGIIPLPNVQGRIDHFGFDPKGRLFISALGNNSEEIIDLSASVRVRSIPDIPRPQGVVYCAELNKLFVGSDEGKLYIYDATSYKLITSLDFGEDVDNLRYDASSKYLYVGYGDGEAGAIAMVDASTNTRLAKEYKLGAHPESFQLEKSGTKIYVNVPDLKQIAVIDRNTGKISPWPIAYESNFPMALDEASHRLFVVTRAPARLVVFDTNSGQMVASLPAVQNSDDLYFDEERKRIYVSGGEGYVDVFQQKGPNQYELLAKIPSAVGARTSGYFGKGKKGFEVFYVAVPARTETGAEVLVYTVQD